MTILRRSGLLSFRMRSMQGALSSIGSHGGMGKVGTLLYVMGGGKMLEFNSTTSIMAGEGLFRVGTTSTTLRTPGGINQKTT